MSHHTVSVGPDIVSKGLLAFVTASALLLIVSWLRSRQAFRRSALHDMPGPPSVSWAWGSAPIPYYEAPRLLLEWVGRYGRTFKFHGMLGTPMLFAGDPKVLGHVLGSASAKYHRSPALRTTFNMLVGRGVLVVEGVEHKKQVCHSEGPAFGPIELRRQAEIFASKANDLCLIWKEMCSKSAHADGAYNIDAFEWINKVTLDIIALAGFNYDTDSLHATDENPNEMNTAVRAMFSFEQNNAIFAAQLMFPLLRRIVSPRSSNASVWADLHDVQPTRRMREIRSGQEVFRRVGMRLITERRAALSRGRSDDMSFVKKNDIEGNDILSLLVKANMAVDLPESLRLSDNDILAQVPTFMVAGHETTSSVVSWGLFSISCSPQVQEKLRSELQQIPTDTPSMEALSTLPYLDNVVREILRLYTGPTIMERYASEDDVIPLSTPYTDKGGNVHKEIIIKKGDTVLIPTQALQLLEEIWGPDVGEFKQVRWDNLPDAVKQIPTIWGSLLTFASGTHACIGYRFAVAEVKALLFAIVRSFKLNLTVPPSEICRSSAVVPRPSLSTNPLAGSVLPLTIRPVLD
ncbi:cytochrome P450 [Vararia minispora EC-137]|uniref:Cytochrome P450 n=1 Tax=Vararia minispora EC-137 TaxID=1314806 RepID=A0ACB8QND7_9AGAM|nr:cytochrome P450 [Vararia minispora EC-137]